MYTLFRVAACYSLDEVYVAISPHFPYANLFLIPYFILMGFGLMNYFGAIIVILLWEFSFIEIKQGGKKKLHIDEPRHLRVTSRAECVRLIRNWLSSAFVASEG
jgi:hypothetical protein